MLRFIKFLITISFIFSSFSVIASVKSNLFSKPSGVESGFDIENYKININKNDSIKLNPGLGQDEFSVTFLKLSLDDSAATKTQRVNGVDRVVYTELNEGEKDEYKDVIEYITTNENIKESFRLRYQAREYYALSHQGKLKVDDKLEDPFYIVLKDKGNSLHANPEKSIIYFGNGDIRLSEINLVVSGLGPVSIKEFIKVPFITDEILMHENFHCVQVEQMGVKTFNDTAMKSSSMNFHNHELRVLTDVHRSYFEGFAIAFERYTADIAGTDINEVYLNFLKNGESYFSEDDFSFIKNRVFHKVLARQTWVRKGLYLPLEQLNNADTLFQYPRDILNSEGIVANTIYNLLISSNIKSIFPKLMQTLSTYEPQTLVEVFSKMSDAFPDDRQKIHKVYLEQTLAVTTNSDVFPLYKEYLNEQTQDSFRFYTVAIESEIETSKYTLSLNTLLKKPLLINTKHLGFHYPPFAIDLNQETEAVLLGGFVDMINHYNSIGLGDLVLDLADDIKGQVKNIIAYRERVGNINSLTDLEGHIEPSFLNLLSKNVVN